MPSYLMSKDLYEEIEGSEAHYMLDRMKAIQERKGNPENVELQQFGDAIVYYSETMPWPQFNTVKFFHDRDLHRLDDIILFFKIRKRKAQF